MKLGYNNIKLNEVKQMCEICRQSPCDNRCPNAPDRILTVIGVCENCGDYLYSDNTFWRDNDCNRFCSKDCVEEFYGIEEVDE